MKKFLRQCRRRLIALSHNCCLPNRHFNAQRTTHTISSPSSPSFSPHAHSPSMGCWGKRQLLKAKMSWAGLIPRHSFIVLVHTYTHTHTLSLPLAQSLSLSLTQSLTRGCTTLVFLGISCCCSVALPTFLLFLAIFTTFIVMLLLLFLLF